MQKMSMAESGQKITWTDLVCEGFIFDRDAKRLSLNTKRYDWTDDREFLAEQGWIHFENLVDVEIVDSEPKVQFEDLVHCSIGFVSYKMLPEGIELDTAITGNRNNKSCEIDYLIIRIFAEFLIWQPETNNE